MIRLPHIILSLILFGFASYAEAMTYGSDSAVNRFQTQLVLNDGDLIAGFASVEAGFIFSSRNVSATWDSVFPITGNIGISNGNLILDTDFIIGAVAQFDSIGTITGNGHVLELGPTVTCFVGLGSSQVFDCFVTLTAVATTPNDVLSLDWSSNDTTIVIGMINNATSNVSVYTYINNILSLKSTIIPNNQRVNVVRWRPNSFEIAAGTNAAAGGQPELFILNYDPVSMILTTTSSNERGVNVTNLAWDATGNFLAVGEANNAGEIRLFTVNSAGVLNGPVQTIDISPNQTVAAMEFDVTGSYLAVGFSTAPHLVLYSLNLSTSTLVPTGASITLPQALTALNWNETPGFQNLLAIGTTAANPNVFIYALTGTGVFQQLASANANGVLVEDIAWNKNGQCIAIADFNHNFNVLKYNPYNFNLVLVQSIFALGLDQFAVAWSPDEMFLALGTQSNLQMYACQNCIPSGSNCFTLSNLHMLFDCDVVFKNACYIFSGQSSIDGKGMILTLDPTCTIVVDANSSLLIQDVTLKNVSGNQLDALANSSTYSFQNVELILDGNYSFTMGRFDVIKDLEIIGNGKVFAYHSDQISTVSSYGRVILDTGVTFSYDPRISANNLFRLSDSTSQLVLDSATLYTTFTALQLTKGYLAIDGSSFFASESSLPGRGLIFGDGLSSANNLNIDVWPAAQATILKGIVENKNV